MNDAQKPQTGRQLESLDAPSLLRPTGPNAFDPIKHAQALAARSKRLCIALTIATVLAWIVACFMAVLVAGDCLRRFRHIYVEIFNQREDAARGKLTDNPQPQGEREVLPQTIQQRQRLQVLQRENEDLMLFATATIGLFGVAALLSVGLTIASRRVALRQINANLLAITTELKKLLPEVPPPTNSHDPMGT